MSSSSAATSFGLNRLQVYYSDSDEDVPPSGETELRRNGSDPDIKFNGDSDDDLLPSSRGRGVTRKRSHSGDGDQLKLEPGKKHKSETGATCHQTSVPKASGKNDQRISRNGLESNPPPVPDAILRMFAKEESSDMKDSNENEHFGRIRSFPHVRGNWASYVYVPFSQHTTFTDSLNCLIDGVIGLFPEPYTIHNIVDKHLTISKTLVFRHHWIEPFVASFKNATNKTKRFEVYFEDFEVYSNDEKTRTFISLRVTTTEPLLRTVKTCDECLADFHLEPYYKDPSFHVSCAWMLGDASSWTKEHFLPVLNDKWGKLLDDDPEMRCVIAESLELKTGNQLYQFPFLATDIRSWQ